LRWRLIRDRTSDPTINLAVEEAILRSRRDERCRDTLRVWRSDRSVVLGCHSELRTEVDAEACRRIGVVILRRISGGGTVYHDLGNINYSVTIKEQSAGANCDVLNGYQPVTDAILKGLEGLGIRAESDGCNAIFLNRKKIAGMAQHRFYDVALIHGTLLVSSDLETLSKVLLRPKHAVTNVSVERPRVVTVQDVEDAIVEGFRKTFKKDLDSAQISEHEIELVHKLVAMKYRREDWNIGTDQMVSLADFSNIKGLS